MTFEKNLYIKKILDILESYLFEIDENDIFSNINFYFAFSKNIIDIILKNRTDFEILEYSFSIFEIIIEFMLKIDEGYGIVFLSFFENNEVFLNFLGEVKNCGNKNIKKYIIYICDFLNLSI